jgi:hypothetical protein
VIPGVAWTERTVCTSRLPETATPKRAAKMSVTPRLSRSPRRRERTPRPVPHQLPPPMSRLENVSRHRTPVRVQCPESRFAPLMRCPSRGRMFAGIRHAHEAPGASTPQEGTP